MLTNSNQQRCALIVLANGFEEADTISLLTILRQAGLCVKSVGLTQKLVSGSHGVWIMPDIAVADMPSFLERYQINYLVLAEGEQSIARLLIDPRIRRIVQRVIAQRGQVILHPEGLPILRRAAIWADSDTLLGSAIEPESPLRLWKKAESAVTMAKRLIQREQSFRLEKPFLS